MKILVSLTTEGKASVAIAIHATVVVLCASVAASGNAVVRALLAHIDPGGKRPSQPALLAAEKELPGGRWIGILERLGVFACIIAGFGNGIAMILAVKGLGRYPELRAGENSKVGELFIIGTFASMLWAAAWAGVALGVMWGVERLFV